MMESFKGWIVTICTIVILIYCIELLMPNNSMRKYAKFTTGLILVVVIISPVLKFMNGDFSMDQYVSKAEQYLDGESSKVDYEKYKNENVNRTIDNFKKNLEVAYKDKLQKKYNDSNFELEIQCNYDEKEGKISVDSVKIDVQDKSIVNVKKVSIGKVENEENIEETPKVKEIKDLVANELNVEKGKIYVCINK
ncbi:stage III sporulation protein AF [Clostridium collagenovorans DSM 3089]|uniref:Stage III sporulation protein AF n=1 Tax=Clostridium collagenovorans DSM 3089 TaxID=1121306 RepID=A0A1M5T3Y0_9CLOT|nr:stage III sporulation protein AF [Clostridium collagenovorans]SHH45392.1 stage III sporulation protein AF [Clostridium collagenovorans DSM 3089]